MDFLQTIIISFIIVLEFNKNNDKKIKISYKYNLLNCLRHNYYYSVRV